MTVSPTSRRNLWVRRVFAVVSLTNRYPRSTFWCVFCASVAISINSTTPTLLPLALVVTINAAICANTIIGELPHEPE